MGDNDSRNIVQRYVLSLESWWTSVLKDAAKYNQVLGSPENVGNLIWGKSIGELANEVLTGGRGPNMA